MNKTGTLRDKLRLLTEAGGPPRDARQLLNAELQTKSARGAQPLALLGSLRLDVALFVHRYFAATVFAGMLLIGGGAWIAFSALGPASPTIAPTVQTFATAAPSQQFSIAAIRWRVYHGRVYHGRVYHGRVYHGIAFRDPGGFGERGRGMQFRATPTATPTTSRDGGVLLNTVEPRAVARAIPSAASIPHVIRPVGVPFHDPPPLDYSGFVVSVSYEQSSIPADPAHPEFAATSTSGLSYQVGYRFDGFEEAGIGYSRHVYRTLNSTSERYTIYGGAGTSYGYDTILHNSDDPISLLGIYYTLHASNLEIFGVEPFVSAFASKPSAGFLWRASAGLEWNAWDKLSAVVTYSREQINSAAYVAPQNIHGFPAIGLVSCNIAGGG